MVNRIFGNRYQIIEKIGMGGMAEVYKATDSTLGRTVAIKVMLPQYASDPTFAARFRQEAQAAANLSSPYIVNIYDWGHDDDSYYIVMEYVRGTDLKTAIQQRGSIHPRKVAEIGSQVCSALTVAHGYDIIHRDIKSANIMVQGDGNVKVMDFGIAEAGHPGMTQDSTVLGTAHYVSPEQAQGKKLTPASDLYSLGIVLYEAATGKLPFDGPDVVSVAMKQVSEQPVPPRQLNPSIDPQFEAIIMTALQKNPDDRFATAKEMQLAIDDYLSGRASAETQVINPAYATGAAYATGPTTAIPNPGSTTIMPGAQMGAIQQPPLVQPKKSNAKRNAILAILAIVIIVGIGLFVAFANGMLAEKVSVPDVVGKSQTEAKRTLENANLKVSISIESSDTVDKGKVISQNPAANTMVEPESEVTLVVSAGKSTDDLITVPNLVGLTASEAEQQLAALGLAGSMKEEASDSVPSGKIISQEPLVNSKVEEGSVITYTVSKGKSTVSVPNVLGDSSEYATRTLEDAGFRVNKEYETSADYAGKVIRMSPRGDAAKGATITITIGKAPAQQPSNPSDNGNGDGSGNGNDDSSGNGSGDSGENG